MMVHGILLRLACAAAICGALAASYVLVSAAVMRRARRAAEGFAPSASGAARIIYFTTRDCAACKAAQGPALRALKDRMEGRLQVIEVDAEARPDLARKWSVLSVPTTFILDSAGKPRQVNHGFASMQKLIGQLQGIMAGDASRGLRERDLR